MTKSGPMGGKFGNGQVHEHCRPNHGNLRLPEKDALLGRARVHANHADQIPGATAPTVNPRLRVVPS